MRILQVARQFHPKIGGIESCVLNLSRGLVERGHHVEVVTLDRDLKTRRPLPPSGPVESIPVHRIPYLGSRRYPIAPSWLSFANHFDVVHIHAIDFFVDSAAVARVSGFLRKPFVVTTHGGIFHTDAWMPVKSLYWRHFLSRTLRVADAVVAVSDSDAALFAGIVSADKLMDIPNGIDPAFAEALVPRVRGRVVCIGRVSEAKSIDQVIHLVREVVADFPYIELVVAGPDEDGTSHRLLQTAADLGLQRQVKIAGELPFPDLATLLASAHLFVSAARHEGFGITTVEALSAGVPVLVTRTGVHQQIVQRGLNGWFWSGSPDPEAVATLREGLLLPDARLDDMQIAARRSAAPYYWSRITEKYERVLESAYRKSVG